MARTPIKSATLVDGFSPNVPQLELTSADQTPPSSLRVGVTSEPALAPRRGQLEPILASALEGLGLIVVGMVQVTIDGKPNVVPVGLAPFAGSDTVDVPAAGFFVDELGRCGILLNGNDGSWQKALPVAVEEARRALASSSAS